MKPLLPCLFLLPALALASGQDDPSPSNGYEVKAALAALEAKPLRAHLGWGGEEAEIIQAWFLDTPSLELLEQGLILRVRQMSEFAWETTVKVRGADAPLGLDPYLGLKGFKTEIDRSLSGNAVWSTSLKSKREGHYDPDRPLEGFTPKQLRMALDLTGVAVGNHPIVPQGPVRVERWRHKVPGFPQAVTLERWGLADGTYLAELSTRSDVSGVEQVVQALRALIIESGLRQAESTGKTSTALLSFSALPSKDSPGLTQGLVAEQN